MAQTTLELILKAQDKMSKDLKGVEKKVRKMDKGIKKVNKTTKKASAGFKKMGDIIAGAFAVGALINFGKESIRLAGIQEKAEARLTASVKNLKNLGEGYEQTAEGTAKATQELKDYARALQKTTTFGDEQIISAEAMLGTFQLSTQEIKKLTPALLDMAASTEKTSGQVTDLNDLAIAMGKAMTTGAGALSRYGITLSETEKKQFNLAKGVEKTALLAQILENNFGGAAKELAATTAGAMKQVENRWGDAMEGVGAVLAPLLLKLFDFAVSAFETLQGWVGDINEKVIKPLLKFLDDMGVDFGVIFEGLGLAAKEVFDFFVEIVVPLFKKFIEIIGKALEGLMKLWDENFLGIKTIVETTFNALAELFKIGWDTFKLAVDTVLAIFEGDWQRVWNNIKGIFENVWKAIKAFAKGIINSIMGFIQGVIDLTKDAIKGLLEMLGLQNQGRTEKTILTSKGIKGGVESFIPEQQLLKKASGGLFSANQTMLVGEEGPEIVQFNKGGNVVPNNELGGNTININISGNNIGGDEKSARRMAQIIKDELVRSMQLQNLNAVT